MSAQAVLASTPTPMFDNSSHTSRGPWLFNLSFTFSLSKLLGFLFPSRLREYLGLALFGLLAELTRRAVIRLLPWIERQISIQAIHPVYDPSHDWVMSWWMNQPSWTKRSKVFNCETEFISGAMRTMPWLRYRGEQLRGKGPILSKRLARNPRLLPAPESSFFLFYKGRPVRLSRKSRKTDDHDRLGEDNIVVQIFFGSVNLYKEFLTEAKRQFQAEDHDLLPIRLLEVKNGEGQWKQVALRTKRGVDSVITYGNIAEEMTEDIQRFFDSEELYQTRGLPHRRGFLLHGVPGSGKTSCVQAVASALDLEIYVIALAAAGLTDSTLLNAIGSVPPGAVCLLEDVDVSMRSSALDRDINRRAEAADDNAATKAPDTGRISLSALLNALDGVTASEGRILCMTTNHVSDLDKALIRPSRIDKAFYFGNATQDQIRRLFYRFYQHLLSRDGAGGNTQSEKLGTLITATELGDCASDYATRIPDKRFSIAAIQGHLLLHDKPRDALNSAEAFVLAAERDRTADSES